MKKLLALVLSMLMVASCFALIAVAEEETTAAEETTVADETTAAEETTEAEPSYSNTLLVFGSNMKVLTSANGIHKTLYKSEWEGARLKITESGDPYISINWSQYINKAKLEKVDSQSYPFLVFKLKVVGYIEDVELFYCAGSVAGATQEFATTTDYPPECSGEIEYIIYDLTGDCEGNYNMFRFDPMGADEDTEIYLYELAMFATEDEAIAYAGLDQEETEPETSEAEVTTEEETEEKTEAPTTEAPTAGREPQNDKKDGCGGIIGAGSVLAIISLGIVCIKKKD